MKRVAYYIILGFPFGSMMKHLPGLNKTLNKKSKVWYQILENCRLLALASLFEASITKVIKVYIVKQVKKRKLMQDRL